MAEAVAGHVVEPDLDHQPRLQRLPFAQSRSVIVAVTPCPWTVSNPFVALKRANERQFGKSVSSVWKEKVAAPDVYGVSSG